MITYHANSQPSIQRVHGAPLSGDESSRGARMAHLHLTPRLRMNRDMPLLPHMPSWCVKGQLYLYHSMSILITLWYRPYRFLPRSFPFHCKQPSTFHSMPSNFHGRQGNHGYDGSLTWKISLMRFKHAINLFRFAGCRFGTRTNSIARPNWLKIFSREQDVLESRIQMFY
jgi:hypothetical protein